MLSTWWLAGLLAFPLQVPRPDEGEKLGRELESARTSILATEADELTGLAEELAKRGETRAVADVRARLPRPIERDGATRFVPMPEVVGPPTHRDRAANARLDEIQSRSATALFELAKRAARSEPPRYALASVCLREVLERRPDHREARRLLGHAPYKGGWARPYAIQQFKDGYVNHPVFGWVKADWLPHLDRGELPSPPSRGGKVQWLAESAANGLRAGWKPPWKIVTEHFEIQTNVPLAHAIGFGRRLEAFHDLFMALLADVLGDNLPLARRFQDPALVGEPPAKRHLVYDFATKQEFVAHLAPKYGDEMADSLGFYDPPKSSRSARAPAYFFDDRDGQLPVEANLYHEVSHQLLFETAGRNAYTANAGNYWVFEGLGTYFETVEPQPDGSLEVGDLVGRRIEEAIKSLVDREMEIPLAQFVALDEIAFMRPDRGRYLRYQQAQALTVFLMQWHQGRYREGFFDYVRDAYRGRIKRGSGRSLQDRLGTPYETLDAQFLAFLRAGRTPTPGRAAGPMPQAENPASATSIRTVPAPR